MDTPTKVINNLAGFDDFVVFLNLWINSLPKNGHGIRQKICAYLNVQTSYFSRVLQDTAPLREVHIEALCDFIGLNSLQTKYFHFLVLYKQANSEDLKSFYRNCFEDVRPELQKPIAHNSTEIKGQAIQSLEKYYSSYIYTLIHMMATIQPLTIPQTAKELNLPKQKISGIFNDLTKAGMLSKDGSNYKYNKISVYLAKDQDYSAKHHLNWRIKALENIQLFDKNDFHYTSVLTCSEKDFEKLKENIRLFIKDFLATVAKSKADKTFSLTIDFFNPY